MRELEPYEQEYARCLMCNGPVTGPALGMALRRFERTTCSAKCRKAEVIRRFACCAKAKPRACACAYSFDCAEHGVRCVGSHD